MRLGRDRGRGRGRGVEPGAGGPRPASRTRRGRDPGRRLADRLAALARLEPDPACEGRTHLAEARAGLRLDRAAQAERALRRATDADPTDPEAWRLRLELLRVEDRAAEAHRLGWAAWAVVRPPSRREVLRGMTLALLADLPDDLARATLDRWVAADPGDVEARVARLARIAAQPRSGDPDRADRIAALAVLLDADPLRVSARPWSSPWPTRGSPTAAVSSSTPGPTASAMPDTGGSGALGARLRPPAGPRRRVVRARAGRAPPRLEDALPPGPRPASRRPSGRGPPCRRDRRPDPRGPRPRHARPPPPADLDRLDDPSSLLDLARLCDLAGLSRLADAWRQEAASPPEGPDGPLAVSPLQGS